MVEECLKESVGLDLEMYVFDCCWKKVVKFLKVSVFFNG